MATHDFLLEIKSYMALIFNVNLILSEGVRGGRGGIQHGKFAVFVGSIERAVILRKKNKAFFINHEITFLNMLLCFRKKGRQRRAMEIFMRA